MTRWSVGMVAAGVVVLVVAALLLAIIGEARGILRAARRSLSAVKAIRGNVEPIWELQTTNDVAGKLVTGAQSIEAKTKLLADSVEAHQTAPAAAAGA
ncbi:MAG TPA: hypothetical protein VFO60_07405 [Candidatus Dormibacteraeota bacterium]|nr:hypothetical protein [Candidatus Dormibacteraeota bacterium]